LRFSGVSSIEHVWVNNIAHEPSAKSDALICSAKKLHGEPARSDQRKRSSGPRKNLNPRSNFIQLVCEAFGISLLPMSVR
jgi:hypothetical protein